MRLVNKGTLIGLGALMIASFSACTSDDAKVEEVKSEVAAPADGPTEMAEKVKETATSKVDAGKKDMKASKKEVAASSDAAAEAGTSSTCTLGEDTRKIWVDKLENGTGCVVKYEKSGDVQDVATAEHDMNHCEEVKTRIANNLGNAGFNCN